MAGWKDLLKIYGLVFGAFLIVFTAEVIIILFLTDPLVGAFGICLGLIPFIIGILIIWYLLKKKTPSPPPHPYQQYGHPGYHVPPPAPHRPPPSPYQPPGAGYGPGPTTQYGSPPGPHGSQYGYGSPPGYGPVQGPYGPPPQRGPQYPSYHQQPPPLPPSYEEHGSLVEKLQIPGVKVLLPGLILAVIVGAITLLYDMVLLFIPCFIIAFSFPSLIWVSYVYSKDMYEPEPGRIVLIALTWGMLSTIPSIIFEIPFMFFGAFVLTAVGAPLVEEFFKPMILPFIKVEIDNELDGIVYGVAAGMGFAMMENLFYEMSVFVEGTGADAAAAWSILALARGLGSTIGHAVGAGVIGYAYGRMVTRRGSFMGLLGAFGLAVALHMTWNGVLTAMGAIDSATAGPLVFVFIIAWPIVEFFILKAFLDRAMVVDKEMFGPGGGVHETTEESLGAVAMSERGVGDSAPSGRTGGHSTSSPSRTSDRVGRVGVAGQGPGGPTGPGERRETTLEDILGDL